MVDWRAFMTHINWVSTTEKFGLAKEMIIEYLDKDSCSQHVQNFLTVGLAQVVHDNFEHGMEQQLFKDAFQVRDWRWYVEVTAGYIKVRKGNIQQQTKDVSLDWDQPQNMGVTEPLDSGFVAFLKEAFEKHYQHYTREVERQRLYLYNLGCQVKEEVIEPLYEDIYEHAAVRETSTTFCQQLQKQLDNVPWVDDFSVR